MRRRVAIVGSLTVAASALAAVGSVAAYVILAQLGGVADALRFAALATPPLLPSAALIGLVVTAGTALAWPRRAAAPLFVVLASAGGGLFGYLAANGSTHVSPSLAVTSGALAWLCVALAALVLIALHRHGSSHPAPPS